MGTPGHRLVARLGHDNIAPAGAGVNNRAFAEPTSPGPAAPVPEPSTHAVRSEYHVRSGLLNSARVAGRETATWVCERKPSVLAVSLFQRLPATMACRFRDETPRVQNFKSRV